MNTYIISVDNFTDEQLVSVYEYVKIHPWWARISKHTFMVVAKDNQSWIRNRLKEISANWIILVIKTCWYWAWSNVQCWNDFIKKYI